MIVNDSTSRFETNTLKYSWQFETNTFCNRLRQIYGKERQFMFSCSTGSRIQQYSIEGDGGLQSAFQKSPTNFPVIMQASGFPVLGYPVRSVRDMGSTTSYLIMVGSMPPSERANTQITNCRRISGGLIAQVALLPFKGGGPPDPSRKINPSGRGKSWVSLPLLCK